MATPVPKIGPKIDPKIGIVSLGCAKALVDSERILSKLRADGYGITDRYDEADTVIVNTCGFLDTAKAESLEAIGEALAENGKVIVTGCMGGDEAAIREAYPGVLAVTGPHQYEAVVGAVHDAVPPPAGKFESLVPPEGLHLTPRHYAYLKISEGCNNRCSFCIIPQLRGDLASRPIDDVLAEAERLAVAGVRELLVIPQDTSAYGQDLRYAERPWAGRQVPSRFFDLCRELGAVAAGKVWVRLHYVYPYPHVDDMLPLMAEGRILPYLDIPFQHASPRILKAMRRPANQEKVLERIRKWRGTVPDLTIRSTFITGFPGETEEDFEFLLDWLEEAQLDRVGAFRYEPVAGAPANDLPEPVDEDEKLDRWERLMDAAQRIGEARTARKVGRTLDVIVDEVREDGSAVCRSKADAPEVDGQVFVAGAERAQAGDFLKVRVERADGFDLFGRAA